MKKLLLCSLIIMLSLSCSVYTPNNSSPLSGRIQYAPTGHPSFVLYTSSTSLNFSALEKEYKSFSTKALSDAYVSRIFNKFLVTTPNPTQVIRQLEFARYLKDIKSDSTYFNSLKTIIANDNSIFTKIDTTFGVPQKKSSESATFGIFVDSLNPNPLITSGLILSMDAGNSASYPGSGTTWTDLSSNANNGILLNGVGYSSANSGSLVFNGTNEYFDFSNKNYSYFNTTYNNGLTISTWLYVPGNFDITNGDGRSIFYRGAGSSGANYFHLSINDPSAPKFRFWIGSTSPFITYSNPITFGRWYNVTVLYQSSPQNVKIYVNNVLEGDQNLTGTLTVGSATYFGNFPGGGWYPKHSQSTLVVYDRLLSTTEMSQNYNALKGRYGL